MSSRDPEVPLIALVEEVDRALVADLVAAADARGFPEVRATHNAAFATLEAAGSRVSDMAARAGITKQSMATIVKDLEAHGLVTITADPTDGRAKVVAYTERGWTCVRGGEAYLREVEETIRGLLGPERHSELRMMLQEVAAYFGRDRPEPAD